MAFVSGDHANLFKLLKNIAETELSGPQDSSMIDRGITTCQSQAVGKQSQSGWRLVYPGTFAEKHGLKLFALINCLEAVKELSYEYDLVKMHLLGKVLDLRCKVRKEPHYGW